MKNKAPTFGSLIFAYKKGQETNNKRSNENGCHHYILTLTDLYEILQHIE